MASEEEKVLAEERHSSEVITAFNRIPYALINSEIEDGVSSDILKELTEICGFYKVYKKGKDFTVEGTNGDYVAATLRYKLAATLINKEARFLFAEPPDITVEAKGDVGKVSEESKQSLTVYNDLVKTILDANNFEGAILKAAKDCFIGKRIAGLVNFNEDDGVTVSFLPSTQFIYETRVGNSNILTKFVCFIIVRNSLSLNQKRIFKKKYELIHDDENDKDVVYLQEALYDGAGALIEEVTEFQQTKLSTIPAVVIINDGLTGEDNGESEIALLQDYEAMYSKLSNADVDAERKSMNPIRYTVDMDNRSTKNLSSAAGSQWDLGTDQNLDKPHPMVGTIESAMNYSSALKTTLDRVKLTGYEQIDMPNISLDSMQGTITSGKALKAIYWPLIVRCKEKMKTWAPQLRNMVHIIIEGAMAYPNCVERYTNDPIKPVDYEVSVIQNLPLPEDEQEEKVIDLSEVEAKVMSKKAYMKKWRQLTDDEANEELEQIALERQIIEDSAFAASGGDGTKPPYGDDESGMPND